MVFSEEDKAIIKHYCLKGKKAYSIWKDNPEKGWHKKSVQRLVNRFNKYGKMDRQKGSGRPVSVATKENEEAIEKLICSQEDEPGTHLSLRNIAKHLEISHTSVRNIIEKKGINQFKRVRTPQMNEGTRKRRVERADGLFEKFKTNPRMIERAVFQDKSDFPLEIPLNSQSNRVYHKGKKQDVPDKNLYHPTN